MIKIQSPAILALLLCSALGLASCAQPRISSPSASPSTIEPARSVAADPDGSPGPVQSEPRREEAPKPSVSVVEPTVDFTGWFASLEDLARAVVTGLNENSPAKLEAIRLSKAGFRDIWYPHSPKYAPDHPEAFEFIWEMAQMSSSKGKRRLLIDYGGQDLVFRSVEPLGVRDFARYLVWDKLTITVFDPVSGKEFEIDKMGSAMELDGHFRLFGYED